MGSIIKKKTQKNNNKKQQQQKTRVWASDLGNPDIFGIIQFSCCKFVQDGFLQLQPGLLTGCSLMPGRLKRQNPKSLGDSTKLASNWERPKLI